MVTAMSENMKQDFNRMGMALLILLAANHLLRAVWLLMWNLPLLFPRRTRFLMEIIRFGLTPFSEQLATALVYTGSMFFAIFTGAWLFHGSRSFLFPLATPRKDYLLPALGTGLGVAMVANLAISLLTYLLGLGGIHFTDVSPNFSGGPAANLVTLFSLTVLPAILEELLFRGVLLQPLRRYGDRVAVVLSALAFALCHPSLPQALNAFVMGLCLGLFAVRTGSLFPSMALHFCYNSYACVLNLLWHYFPTSGMALGSWLVVFVLIGLGIYAFTLLRRRFGPVLWMAPAASPTLRFSRVAATALCSVPLLVAGFFYLSALVRNIRIIL